MAVRRARDDEDRARTVGTRFDPCPSCGRVGLSGATAGGVTGLIVGGGIGGGFGILREGFLEFHPFAGPGGMPLTPASCAREAAARTDVSATASNALPLIRLLTKRDFSFAGVIRLDPLDAKCFSSPEHDPAGATKPAIFDVLARNDTIANAPMILQV
jgi:hypothetical protein